MRIRGLAWALIGLFAVPIAATAQDGFVPIFDGKSLEGWDGNPAFWKVEDGCLTGSTTKENPTKGNTFCIWRGGDVGDFELTLEYKLTNHNSGIQYRSVEGPAKWVVGGYQADMEGGDTYSGIVYAENFGGILANRGQKTVVRKDASGKQVVEVVGQVGDSKEIQSKIKKDDWNTYHIIAKGFTFEHRINGVTTAICTDERPEHRARGILALQLHAGPPMKVQFRNIRLKAEGAKAAQGGAKKKVLLLAGGPSHGFGAHDHLAGCSLLARQLNASGLPIEAEVHALAKQGWPSPEKLAGADAIVIYADGGGGHPFNAHLPELDRLLARGTGLVCIHYGVEVPRGQPGDAFLKWTGGYFEANWSVNPHWTADFAKYPDHPTTRGVRPFKINDEWYYHMRFRPGMEGVTPILTDLPPKSTLDRPDGTHSGNPAVREAIAKGEPQHVAWATERPGGGRGFGCSGGHVHWNWGQDQFRKLFLNAIAWSAGLEVPSEGVEAGAVTVDDLLKDHDEPVPAGFDKGKVQAQIDRSNGKGK
jgi:type 1 glutamine amidotransferase